MIVLKINDQTQIRIHEYKEARKTIFSLAEKYKEDITPVCREGKNRNKVFYYNYPCSFDIETSTIRPGSYGYEHPDGRPLGVPYLFQWNIYDVVIMCRYIEEAARIFEYLGEAFCYNKRKLIIFDHNLGYEYGFFKDYWPLIYDECFALDIHHPVTLHLKNGLIIRDSYKMTNMSLDTLAKDWSREWLKAPDIMVYNKIRMPWDSLDEMTLLYSALDVLSLSDAIEGYLSARNEKPWTKNPTSTSFIRSAYKKVIGLGSKKRTAEQRRYFNTLNACKIDKDIYAMLTRQARGGNTHTNRAITGIEQGKNGKGVGHGDIGSSYPTQIVCLPEFPISYWEKINPGARIEDIIFLEQHGYCTLFDVTLLNPRIKKNIPVPYLAIAQCRTLKGFSAYSDNGRYLSGAEMLQTTIYGIEWNIIASQYDFDNVVITAGYFARKGYLPDILRRFVLDLYAKKTELKGIIEKAVEYALAKTYVNGVFGMAFTRIIREKMRFDERGIFESEMPEPEKELQRFQNSTSYFLCYAWGSMVATLGRVHLQKMIDCCGFKYFLYCDTDSVFYKHPEIVTPRLKELDKKLSEERRRCGLQLVYNDKKGRPHELGVIDFEEECSFKSLGAKKYITITESAGLVCTIAGVPKKKGSKLLTSMDDFKEGKVFEGTKTGKMCLWYNDDEKITIKEGRHRLRIKSNIAMLPVDYILGIGNDYLNCLQIEGINPVYSFSEADKNIVEEYI